MPRTRKRFATDPSVEEPIDSSQYEPAAPDAAAEPDTWERIAAITPEEWAAGYSAYLYRLWPVIERKADSHYICRMRESFDEDQLMQLFGSGKYMVILKNRATKLATFTTSLHNPQFPPKVSPDEVVKTDPQNERYFKVWGNSAAQAAPAATATPAHGADPVTAGLASQLGSITEKLMEGNLSGHTPNAQLVELWNKTATERDQLASRLVEMSRVNNVDPLDTLDKVGKIMERFGGRAEPQKTPVEQMNEMVLMWESMKNVFGTPEPVAQPPESVWKHIAPALLPALAPITNVLAQKLMGVLMPTGATPGGGLQTDADVAAAATAAPASAAAPQPSDGYEHLVRQLVGMAVSSINQQRDGADFAYAFETLHGNLNYRQLAALGRENLIVALRSHPSLGQDVFKETVETFVDQFLIYGKEEGEADGEDEPTPKAA